MAQGKVPPSIDIHSRLTSASRDDSDTACAVMSLTLCCSVCATHRHNTRVAMTSWDIRQF